MNPAETPGSILRCQRITALRPEAAATACLLADGGTVLVSRHLAGFLQPGDELEFSPILTSSTATELRVSRSNRSRPKQLYLAPIGYVTQPKEDKRHEAYLRAEVAGGGLGVRSVHLPASAVRDYFYRADRTRNWSDSRTLYDVLHVAPTAAPGDLRLGYKLRQLELQPLGANPSTFRDLERAFNLLMQPQLRACYDALLLDPEAPVLFPYTGFGALLAAGELSRDRETFFAQRVLSFLPDLQRRRFRSPLRRIDFLRDHAIYRDSRRKLEVMLDPIALSLHWDSTWNQWKHLLGAKIGIDATFVASGKYRLRSGEWHLVPWLTALPSRIELSVPADIHDQIQAAKRTHHRFGQYSAALERIRARVEREPLERRELDRLCGELGIPDDFDVRQISWKPDYDPFFYDQLRKRARRTYMYRDEYVFDLQHAIVVEVPEVGHATYVFAKPDDIDQFVRAYARTTKDDIRRNRGGVAERLGFIGRVMHGSNQRTWLREVKVRIGESAELASSVCPE